MADLWVLIEHSDFDAPPSQVTRKAYENVWKSRGFRLVELKKLTKEKDK